MLRRSIVASRSVSCLKSAAVQHCNKLEFGPTGLNRQNCFFFLNGAKSDAGSKLQMYESETRQLIQFRFGTPELYPAEQLAAIAICRPTGFHCVNETKLNALMKSADPIKCINCAKLGF